MNVFSDMWMLYFHGGVVLSFMGICLQLRWWGVLNDEP